MLKVYPHLSGAERAELCGFAKVEGWKVQRSVKHFGAHPMAPKAPLLDANNARKSAEAAFKLKNKEAVNKNLEGDAFAGAVVARMRETCWAKPRC